MSSESDKIAALVVNKWEALSIATTDIDGPLSTFAKGSLIRIISETLDNYKVVLQAEVKSEKRKPGRPPKCPSPPLPQQQQSD